MDMIWIIAGVLMYFAGVVVVASSLDRSKDNAGMIFLVLMLVGGTVFTLSFGGLVASNNIGVSMPFDRLEQNKVYQVVEKIPNMHLVIITNEKEKEGKIVKVSELLDKNLEKGERFIRVGDKIAKLSP